jgi:hypothetical protein
MTKISLKTFAILSSALALTLAGYGIIHACAGGDWEGYDYDSSFTPEVYVDASYAPLFYAPNEPFYEIGFEHNYVSRFNDDMVADWTAYLEGRLSKDEVAALLVKENAAAAAAQLYTALQKKQPPPPAFSRVNLADEKVKNFITFLSLAGTIEASSIRSADSWDYSESTRLPAVKPQTVAQAEKLCAETKDEFLKNRYWFQAMKGHFYSAHPQNAVAFFEKTKATVPQNTLYYRGLAYTAGVAYKAKNYATSNYLYAVVFDKCPALRTVATYNFHPVEQADFQAALNMAQTMSEKIALWSLFGYYADEKVAIREIYKLNPKSEQLDYLLTRLVNKEEVSLNASRFESADAYRQHMKEHADKDALQLVGMLAQEGKTAKPYLWNLAAGYLNIFAGNNTQASQLFDKVEKGAPKSELAGNQLHTFRIINALSATTRLDAATETRLLPDLAWLYKLPSENALRKNHVTNWSRQYIASLYQKQGNAVYAELFNRDSRFYQIPGNLEAMKKLLLKTDLTPWEKMATSLYDLTLLDIYEYEGIMLAYGGKFDEAIAQMKLANNDVELYGNPFNGKIKDCHDCDHAAAQKVKYTKTAMLEKMKDMQVHIDKGEDVYNNALLLANAHYNMTYFGNARVFYENKIINHYGNDISDFYAPQLLSCATADRYYKMAFAAATTDEQRAKCVYMMAKCERNEKFHGDPENESLAWEGFKQLKTKYANTKYYKEVINECGYFNIYLSRGH